MIWNGTDPLQPDHEVAYRAWPTERVRIVRIDWHERQPVLTEPSSWYHQTHATFLHGHTSVGRNPNAKVDDPFDLIPLQQEQPK